MKKIDRSVTVNNTDSESLEALRGFQEIAN